MATGYTAGLAGDIAALAMENQVVASSAGSFWGSLGSIFDAATGAINTIANVLPKVEDIVGVFGGGDDPAVPITQPTSDPNSLQPVISQAGAALEPAASEPAVAPQTVFFQAPAAESGLPTNLMLYAAIAAVAYFLLR